MSRNLGDFEPKKEITTQRIRLKMVQKSKQI